MGSVHHLPAAAGVMRAWVGAAQRRSQVSEDTQPTLFTILDAGSGRHRAAPPRTASMTLPQRPPRVLMADSRGRPASCGGRPQRHRSRTDQPAAAQAQRAGASPLGRYTPVVTHPPGRSARHHPSRVARTATIVHDPGHAHHGADNYLGGGFIVARSGAARTRSTPSSTTAATRTRWRWPSGPAGRSPASPSSGSAPDTGTPSR